MRFVHNDGANVPMLMAGLKEGMSDALRGHVQELGVPKPNVVQHPVAVVAHPGFCTNAAFSKGLALVFHQGHQGGDHDAQSAPCQSRQLKAQALATCSRHQRQHVMALVQVQHGPHLMRPEGVETPVRFEERLERLRKAV